MPPFEGPMAPQTSTLILACTTTSYLLLHFLVCTRAKWGVGLARLRGCHVGVEKILAVSTPYDLPQLGRSNYRWGGVEV